jgi:hypothetical protein
VTILLALAAFYSAMMLLRYGRRGVLVLAPSLIRSRSTSGGPLPTEAQRAAAFELEALGFRRIGSRVEEGPLRGLGLRSESFVDPARSAFADVFEHGPRSGAPARLQMLSVFPDGAAVLTANHGRAPQSGRWGEVTGLPGAALGQVAEVHRRTVLRLESAHGASLPATDLAGRDAAARNWYRRAGGWEIRRRFAIYLGNSVFAAAILAFSIAALVRTRAAP